MADSPDPRKWEQLPQEEDGQFLVCEECDRGGFVQLAIHTWQAHGLSADDYRARFRIRGDVGLVGLGRLASLRAEWRRTLKKHPDLQERGVLAARENDSRTRLSETRRNRISSGLIRANRPPENHDELRQPHDCPICGALIPTARPLTCSKACANVLRDRSGFRDKAAAKRAKPHPCPVCGVTIPTNSRRTCSEACARARMSVMARVGR